MIEKINTFFSNFQSALRRIEKTRLNFVRNGNDNLYEVNCMAKIIIIGGGVSGLSAGIYAQMDGHQAILCEKQNLTGGNLTGWQRGEYHIDNCIHWLTGTNPHTKHYKIWTDLGALDEKTEIYQADILYTYEYRGQRLSLHKDLARLEKDMLEISPSDEKEIRSLIKAVRLIQGASGIAGENHDEKSPVISELFSLPTLYKYYKLSTGALAERFSHPLLQKFINAFIGEQFSAIALLVVFATFCGENGGIPKGSSKEMAKRMTKRFTDLGGEVLLHKQAVKIHTEKDRAVRVDFSDGTSLNGDYFIITADPALTFGTLLDKEMPKPLQKLYADPNMLRFSGYQCAFSCDENALPFRGDFLFPVPKKFQAKLHTKNMILREFSHEKEFAPKGKTVLQSLTFCDEKTSKEFILLHDDPAKYKAKKREIANAVSSLITEKFPILKGKIRCLDVWTPATYKRYTQSEIGSFMSFVFPPNTPPKRIDNRVSGIKNLLLATQWLQAPGGLPISAEAGKRAVEIIRKKEKTGKKIRE